MKLLDKWRRNSNKISMGRIKKPRSDYRRFDIDSMNNWGFNAFWLRGLSNQACIFSPNLPRVGDVLTSEGTDYVITSVTTPSDPGDQSFVDVRKLD